MQNGTVCRIENVFNQNVDFGSTDPKIYADITYQRVSCILFSEREKVTVIAELPLANSVQVLKNRTDFVVRGELSYNKNLYVGLNSENHKAQIRVTLLKEHVFDYTPVVIGSSVGGFALLILMIFFLYKCGFFKRNYQHMREQDDSLKVDQDAGWNDRQSDESENLNGN
nr:integrin alpha-E-like isoform X1 [Pogona vitticeps]